MPAATAPLLLGVVAKEPVYAPELLPRTSIADSLICAGCDGQMVITYDALQRPRKRCPNCDGIAAPKPPHPDQVLVPVTLASLTAIALPPVEPRQLRCQRCAKGVEGHARFHTECARARTIEARQRRCACGAMYVAVGGAKACPVCRKKSKARPQLCTGCNRLRSGVRGPRVVRSCSECRPLLVPRPKAPRAPKPPRVRKIALATYQPKTCGCGCGTTFQPTGPRSKYAEGHR